MIQWKMQRFFLEPIKKIESNSANYPKLLKKLSDFPSTLYFRGKLLPARPPARPPAKAALRAGNASHSEAGGQNEMCFAIVGTRRCSDYGKEIAFSFARELSKAGFTIVSGMARGIDTFAHKGALSVNGRTIAVLGTGLNENVIYPRENLGLAKEIIDKGGCLISEYSSEIPGSKFTFPQRNRIISGISLGVLVIEAKFGSGSLITAKHAAKQDKKIFAIPGSIHSLNSKGTNDLIKKGAILTEQPNDILKALNIQQLPLTDTLVSDTNSNPHSTSSNSTEMAIMKALSEGNLHIDKIIERTNLPPQEVSGNLSLMEIENKIKNLGGNVYALLR